METYYVGSSNPFYEQDYKVEGVWSQTPSINGQRFSQKTWVIKWKAQYCEMLYVPCSSLPFWTNFPHTTPVDTPFPGYFISHFISHVSFYSPPKSTLPPMHLYILLDSLVIPCCIHTSEDLDLGTTDDKEHMAFVFWCVCYLNITFPRSIHLLINFLSSFFFLPR